MSKKFKKNAGMSLVEIIIASAIVLVLSVILISANLIYYKTSTTNIKTVQATYLLEEGIEAVNYIKNSDWDNLNTVDTNYYLAWDGQTWQATSTQVIIDGIFERKFFTEVVNRDANDDMAVSGTPDSNTRKLTVQVSWLDSTGTTTIKYLSSYIVKPNEE